MLESGICPVRCSGWSAGESRYWISVRNADRSPFRGMRQLICWSAAWGVLS